MEIGTLHFWIGSIRYRHILHLSIMGKEFPLEEFTKLSSVENIVQNLAPRNEDDIPYILVEDSTEPENDSSSSSSDDQEVNSDIDNLPAKKLVSNKARPTGKPANFVEMFIPHGFERAHSPQWFSSSSSDIPEPKSSASVCVNRCCKVCKCIDAIRAKRPNKSDR